RTVVWFRRDLRIEDNPALSSAAKDGSVLPIFIWCPEEEGQYQPGRVSRWWLKQSLIHLQSSLKNLGAELLLIKAKSTLSALLDCISGVGANRLVYNHLYDPISVVRDHEIKQKLVELGIEVQSYNSELLFQPWEVYNDGGQPFTTFNAYWEKCLELETGAISHLPPWSLVDTEVHRIESCTVESLGLENDSEKSSNALLGRAWSPGWSNADKAFNEFIESHLVNYSKDRVQVGGNSTSLLSPYLHFGELSVRKVFQTVIMKQVVWKNERNVEGLESASHFLRAIGLREYSRYICFNFPFTHERPLLNALKFFPWDANENHFKAWRQGRTGYPLVDAGMRELWATGWVHNRIRVIVSSFCVKFLLIPWQWGMKYFWDTLLDADLESDILGWQYISGSLPDGHELDRMDCPQIQGFKFDPEGEYVRQWLPELARMPTEWIHHPWDAPLSVLKSAGIELGLNYPNPIFDVDVARDRLMEAISVMRENEATSNAANSDEVVVDNSDMEAAPKFAVREAQNPNPMSSSHDQQVPSMGGGGGGGGIPINKKRPNNLIQEELKHSRCKNGHDMSSTAESSSSSKKPPLPTGSSSSRNTFSVPQRST
ncbi:cryptochrome 2, partial [Genlisea aurea]